MIKSFNCKETEKIWNEEFSKKLPGDIQKKALAKLLMLDAADVLSDLRIPPNNRLEILKRDRQGQHSIRINDQYRLCFKWFDNNVYNVEIVDYH
ncbi:MAG: type II toxin-antitoxin system RelE/ParE family toxin [Heliobacteriaceae bacterium]|jgi:proteic killer suppression protein|nr:type II toxin-antitoxin system RelE/ParE family toxin [Heliobacteriaceae bacterium]